MSATTAAMRPWRRIPGRPLGRAIYWFATAGSGGSPDRLPRSADVPDSAEGRRAEAHSFVGVVAVGCESTTSQSPAATRAPITGNTMNAQTCPSAQSP